MLPRHDCPPGRLPFFKQRPSFKLLRFSITTLIILTVWAALILNANLNSSRVRASRLRTGTLVDETKIASEQYHEIQRRIKKEEPAHLRNLARLETTREFKRRLDAAFQQSTEANSNVRPVPGKFSIRKIPNLPFHSYVADEGYRYDFQVFLPDGLAARRPRRTTDTHLASPREF